MLLGIDWLQNLDEMTFSFKDQRVKFMKEGKTWEFTGIPSQNLKLVPAKRMDKTMYQPRVG